MPDLSIVLPSPALEEAFLRIVDPEEKLLAALESLGPVIDRDVIVLDCGNGFRARQLEEMGARVVAFEFPLCDASSEQLAGWIGRADAVVVPWSEMAAPGSRFRRAPPRNRVGRGVAPAARPVRGHSQPRVGLGRGRLAVARRLRAQPAKSPALLRSSLRGARGTGCSSAPPGR